MRTSDMYSRTVIVFAVLCLGISSADRTRRQIVVKDNSNVSFVADCTTPDERPGRCLRLTTCKTAPQGMNRTTLRQYLCDFEGSEPKICCPQPRMEASVEASPRKVEDPKPPFLPESCGVSLHTKRRIVGGKEAVSGSWPWMAVVYIRQTNGVMLQECGGSLVTNQHIVTATHCVVTRIGARPIHASRFRVRLGAHNLTIKNEPGSIEVSVEDVRRHQMFSLRYHRNDIAVLKLSRPVKFTDRISPICLPYDSLQRKEDLDRRSLFAIGHGSTKYNGKFSDVLREVSLDIVDQETCNQAYRNDVQITDAYMCAGVLDGTKDTCQGDSGGPLMAVGKNNNFYLVGVVSFGRRCGEASLPGVYTRVTEFRNWLTKKLSN